LLAYLSLVFVYAFTPGATTANVIRHTLAGGVRRGLTASAGSMTANALQALFALIGVSALIVRWPAALDVLRIGGGLFLAWVGIKSLIEAWRGSARDLVGNGEAHAGTPYRDGFTINILNPSVTSFYVAVVPSFLPPGARPADAALFYLIHIAVAFSCHTFWATAFNFARGFFASARTRRWLDAAIGVLMLWLAYKVIASAGPRA
jgi:threonine/homoserine/homoserine lactone efflux protein